jgi:N-acyl-D-aspartate/D-glutamate deacylase
LGREDVRARVKADFSRDWLGADNLARLCGWEGVTIASAAGDDPWRAAGRTLAEIAADHGLSPEEACLKVFEAAGGQATVLLRNMAEDDLRDILRSPSCFIASDGLPAGNMPHPRLYGNFARFLTLVRDEGLMTLEEAVRRITLGPARRFRLGRRGLIEAGQTADLVIFDFRKLEDRATFRNPRRHPKGVAQVLVAGQVAAEDGEPAGGRRRPGRFLRRGPA